MSGALDGVKVVDFGHYIAGPLTGMLLAEQGAEVVHIESPAGPSWRSPATAVFNRSKHALTADLKNPTDRERVLDLVRDADVLIENFRPRTMDRLGLGSQEMLEANPRLVYCSLPGFGRDDDRADLQGWEGLVQAAAALPHRPGTPAFSAVPTASVFGAMFAAVAVTMSLKARERDGVGQWIEVPLLDAALGAHGFRIQRVHSASPEGDPDGKLPGLHGWMGTYQCADGRFVFFHPGNSRAGAFVETVGGTGWSAEPDLRDRVGRLFMSRDSRYWDALGASVGTEIAIYRTSAEWLCDAEGAGLDIIHRQDPQYGAVLEPGVPIQLQRTPGAVGTTDSGWLSKANTAGSSAQPEHTSASAPDAASGGGPVSPMACLAGVRVLELTFLLAGPTCGRTMVEFGADVIKISNPYAAPTPGPWVDSYRAFHIDVDRGKRSITLNLKTAEGKNLFMRLVKDADIVVQNYRPGVMESLGIGYDEISAVNPRVVYASISCYPPGTEWAHRPGHEHLAQAVTGMATRFGGAGTPAFQIVRAPTDHGTGLMAAFAIGLALLERERSGLGQHVHASLAGTAALLQSSLMYDFEGRRWDEVQGQQVLGSNAFQRLYRTSDGWVYLGSTPGRTATIRRALGLKGDEPLEAALETTLASYTTAEAVRVFRAQGLSAHELCSLRDLIDDRGLRARGLVVTRRHGELGDVDQLGPVVRLSRTPTTLGHPATPLGSEAREIIELAGMSGVSSQLQEAGAVRLLSDVF